MSNDVTVRHSQQLTNIETAAREDAAFEKMLKCKKGEYWIQDQQIPLGTEYLAHTTGWVKCWIKFTDGEVAERKMYRVAFGEKAPEREDLGDLDENEWPEGLDEKPADPWVFQYLLPFENLENGEVVIFVTSSFGGRLAVADLCNAYVKRCKKNPRSGQPIIRLAKAELLSKKFGKVPRPLFEVVRWDDDVQIIEPTLSGELNDSIPF